MLLGDAAYLESARNGEDCGKSSAVIGDAGTAQFSVGIYEDIVFEAGRKDSIEMRRDGEQRPVGRGLLPGGDVTRAIHLRLPPIGPELLGHPLGSLMLEECLRGNAADLKVGISNPVLFAR